MNQCYVSETAMDLIYLVSCAVNNTTPDAHRCSEMNDAAVYNLAKNHMLAAAAACALEKVMPLKQHWLNAKGNSKRRLFFYQVERTRLLKALDEQGIWYLPLKGIILKDMYPETTMREMSDNDILCDPSKMYEIKTIMKSMGFTCAEYGKMHHDVYHKAPMSFEIHSKLFNRASQPKEYSYYRTVKERLIKDDNNRCGYHMTDEDFYIYCINHMYKHFSHAGTGLRSLLDIYVINKAKGRSLDRSYISGELDFFGLREYELRTRLLSEKVFSLQPLTDSDKKELARYTDSGSYGNLENLLAYRLNNDDSKKSKRRYLLKRFFPTGDMLELSSPTVYRHKSLYPFFVVYRSFKGLIKKRKILINEYKTLRRYRNTEDNTNSN